jgi:hypothetical protein
MAELACYQAHLFEDLLVLEPELLLRCSHSCRSCAGERYMPIVSRTRCLHSLRKALKLLHTSVGAMPARHYGRFTDRIVSQLSNVGTSGKVGDPSLRSRHPTWRPCPRHKVGSEPSIAAHRRWSRGSALAARGPLYAFSGTVSMTIWTPCLQSPSCILPLPGFFLAYSKNSLPSSGCVGLHHECQTSPIAYATIGVKL